MSNPTPNAREGALAQLAAEAARFEQMPRDLHERPRPAAPRLRPAPSPAPPPVTPAAMQLNSGYVPVAVAPERGNTRPVVPVDGRLHMRVASVTLHEVDAIVRAWKDAAPQELRDLERATLVRVGLAMVLEDVRENGDDGAVGEAIRAALDPRVRHTDTPMPPLSRWLRKARPDSSDPVGDEATSAAVLG